MKINSLCSLSQLLSQIESIRRMKVTFSDIFGIPENTHKINIKHITNLYKSGRGQIMVNTKLAHSRQYKADV